MNLLIPNWLTNFRWFSNIVIIFFRKKASFIVGMIIASEIYVENIKGANK